ncbi:rhodanese-like domain-containing protein, partial [Paenibacillus sp. 1001270B_150601_E10]|uniref:rhodanese-like domain-containing protein n=1 Tax=Paenibacillus sp. 1001270B_150601_E10 TaxID=2787079 RepID=UPI001E3B0C94
VGEIPTAQEIIFICRSGYRSERVCEYLQHLGMEGAVNMSGGMLAWASIAGPTQLPS